MRSGCISPDFSLDAKHEERGIYPQGGLHMARRLGVSAVTALLVLATSVSAQRLSLTQELIDGKNGIATLGGARSVAISSTDGAFVHVAASSDDNDALTTFSRSMTTGHLT